MNQNEIVELNNLIDICHQNLKKTKVGKDYLFDERKISTDMFKTYQLGFFPKNIKTLCKHVSEEFLKKIGMMNYDGSSDFSDYYSIIFPIRDEYGNPMGLAGRTMLSESDRTILDIPKYKNSKFKKTNFLFGLNLARRDILLNQNVFVVEGYFDQMSMFDSGITNTVAVCGTAFSKNHFIKLSRYTDKITFFLDMDDGGKKSSSQIYNKFISKGAKLRFLGLPSGYKDAGEYFLNSGKAKEDFFNEVNQILPLEW